MICPLSLLDLARSASKSHLALFAHRATNAPDAELGCNPNGHILIRGSTLIPAMSFELDTKAETLKSNLELPACSMTIGYGCMSLHSWSKSAYW